MKSNRGGLNNHPVHGNFCRSPVKLGARPLGGKKNEHFRGWNGLFISRGEATGGGKLRQLFLELEMNRMGGGRTQFSERHGGGGQEASRAPQRGIRSSPRQWSRRPSGRQLHRGGRRLACVRRKGGRPNAPPCSKTRHRCRRSFRKWAGGHRAGTGSEGQGALSGVAGGDWSCGTGGGGADARESCRA